MISRRSSFETLIKASKNGDYKTIEDLVTRSVINVDLQDGDGTYGRNALIWSIRGRHTACATLLQKYTIDPNFQDYEEKTALMHICDVFRPSMLGVFDAILSDEQLDIAAVDLVGWTALHWCSINGHIQLVKKILSRFGFQIVNVYDVYGRNSAMLAANRGSLEVLKELLKNEADVDSVDNDGKSGLMLAARCGHTDCVLELYKNGASLDRVDSDGQSVLFLAASNYHTQCVIKLFQLGCKLLYKNRLRVSVLNIISNDTELAGILLAAGCKAFPEVKLNFDESPPSLMEYSRKCIRLTLSSISPRDNLFKLVDELPLPRPLQRFLLYDCV